MSQLDIEFSKLEVKLSSTPTLKPDFENPIFGKVFTDHMLTIHWTEDGGGWENPTILPFQPLQLSPSAQVLHYANVVFEGMKAMKGVDGKIRMFRPRDNLSRLNSSALRCSLPTFNEEELLKCIKKLLQIDAQWVPPGYGKSIYIRPTIMSIEPVLGARKSKEAQLTVILCPVANYFSEGGSGLSIYVETNYVRAWPGGTGDAKLGANYAGPVMFKEIAKKQGCDEVLWVFGEEQKLTEVGTMNLFIHLTTSSGENQLITPPLNGLILPGITRRSVLELASKWDVLVEERDITMAELKLAAKENRLHEVFGTGTACAISKIRRIIHQDECIQCPAITEAASIASRAHRELMDIQYGVVGIHKWTEFIDEF